MRHKPIEKLTWRDATPPRRLCFCKEAPSSPGIYELGLKIVNGFLRKYLGSAADQSLKDRLSQHFNQSHNENVELIKTRVWFRCIPTATGKEALYLEGHYLAAFREDYPWNKRHEWSQMWILDEIRNSS